MDFKLLEFCSANQIIYKVQSLYSWKQFPFDQHFNSTEGSIKSIHITCQLQVEIQDTFELSDQENYHIFNTFNNL